MQHGETAEDFHATCARQNAFHAKIEKYVNGAILRRRDLALSLLGTRLPMVFNTSAIIAEYQGLRKSLDRPGTGETRSVSILPYDDDHPCVLDMMRYLRERFSWELVGAYVHGSLGSGEPVAYSDFDALVILNDRVFDSRADLIRTCGALSTARRYMHGADPLQHHGWFVLTETDLRRYCNAYFPLELFAYTRSLLPTTGLTLSLCPRYSGPETEAAFVNLARGVLRSLEENFQVRNAFRAKSILSRFMLLPSLYFQAMTGKGIFKGQSFDAVREDFSPEVWRAMDDVSAIRQSWDYEMNGLQRRLSGTVFGMRSRLLAAFGPAVSPKVGDRLSPALLEQMSRLTKDFIRNYEARPQMSKPRDA